MIYYFDEAGRITRRADIPFIEASFSADEGEQWVESERLYSDATHFIFCGAFVPFPARPSVAHLWDWGAYEWAVTADSVAKMKSERCEQVDRLCIERQDRPVDYDGVVFDADAAARENIAGVVTRIARGDGLTAGWIGWRAFDNSMVWSAASADEVAGHLRGLSCLIEDRKQALLAAAWMHKAALAGLESVEAVLAYDITAGWPV